MKLGEIPSCYLFRRSRKESELRDLGGFWIDSTAQSVIVAVDTAHFTVDRNLFFTYGRYRLEVAFVTQYKR